MSAISITTFQKCWIWEKASANVRPFFWQNIHIFKMVTKEWCLYENPPQSSIMTNNTTNQDAVMLTATNSTVLEKTCCPFKKRVIYLVIWNKGACLSRCSHLVCVCVSIRLIHNIRNIQRHELVGWRTLLLGRHVVQPWTDEETCCSLYISQCVCMCVCCVTWGSVVIGVCVCVHPQCLFQYFCFYSVLCECLMTVWLRGLD